MKDRRSSHVQYLFREQTQTPQRRKRPSGRPPGGWLQYSTQSFLPPTANLQMCANSLTPLAGDSADRLATVEAVSCRAERIHLLCRSLIHTKRWSYLGGAAAASSHTAAHMIPDTPTQRHTSRHIKGFKPPVTDTHPPGHTFQHNTRARFASTISLYFLCFLFSSLHPYLETVTWGE